MNLTPEERKMRSERMKQRWAEKREQKPSDVAGIPEPSVATLSPAPPPLPKPVLGAISVTVDWEHLPMPEAQKFYASLKQHIENAGRILNRRSMPVAGSYTCFMCNQTHLGEPRGKDYSYQNQTTGLMQPVEICSERCWINYQQKCIDERRARLMPPRN